MTTKRRAWAIDGIIGAIVGLVVGAIIAVNVVIFAGPDQGYESSPGDVFDHSVVVGIVTVGVLAAAPIAGVLLARRTRRNHPE